MALFNKSTTNTPNKLFRTYTGNPTNPVNKANPNANNKWTQKAFKQVENPEDVNTGVINDQSMVNYKGLNKEGKINATINGDRTYTHSGEVMSNARLKNNVQANFIGTLGENLKTIKKLNRDNWTGSHGFRGKGWDTGLDKAEKKEFKDENAFFVKGRSRHRRYDFENPQNNTHDNNRTYTFKK